MVVLNGLTVTLATTLLGVAAVMATDPLTPEMVAVTVQVPV